MYLLLSIILSTVLGFVLLMLGPLYGGLIAFGIVLGCIYLMIFIVEFQSYHRKEIEFKKRIKNTWRKKSESFFK